MTLSDAVMSEKTANSDLRQNDRSVAHVMELVFNQVAVMEP